MAEKHYGYKPDGKDNASSKITKTISNNFHPSIGDKAVRKWLKAANDLVGKSRIKP